MTSLLGKAASTLNRMPVPYSAGGSRMAGLFSSQRAQRKMTSQMEAYGSVGTLFAIVDGLAESTSRVEWVIREKKKTDDPNEVQKVRHNHPALHVWTHPNRFWTEDEFQEASQQHFELAGETWWVIEKTPFGTPMHLWPVRPDRMEPIPGERRFLVGYVYHGPDGEQVPLDLDEVIFFRKPNPLDPYRGLSAVQSILTDLSAASQATQWVEAFFRNSAQPGGLIEVDKRLGEDEFNELRDRWAEQHKGPTRAHRVAILEQGKWVERKYSMADMQFAEIRNVGREMIRESFRFPKPLLGTVDDVNRANADAAEVMFARWLVIPRLDRMKTVLDTYFLPMFPGSEGLEFHYTNPVPPDVQTELQDRQARAIAARQYREAGWNPDDILETLDLPAMRYDGPPNKGGDSSGEASDIDQKPQPAGR